MRIDGYRLARGRSAASRHKVFRRGGRHNRDIGLRPALRQARAGLKIDFLGAQVVESNIVPGHGRLSVLGFVAPRPFREPSSPWL